jgi:hypothetical protein
MRRLLPLGTRGIVLVAVTTGAVETLRPRLEALCEPRLRAAARSGLVTAGNELRLRVDRETFGQATLLLLVEVVP